MRQLDIATTTHGRVLLEDGPPAGPIKLLAGFHGYGQNAEQQESYSGLVPLSDTSGFILVTPEGSGYPEGWDIVGVYNENGIDDTQFVVELVQQLSDTLCLDQNRIFANTRVLPQLTWDEHTAGAIDLYLRHIRRHIVHEQPTFAFIEALALYFKQGVPVLQGKEPETPLLLRFHQHSFFHFEVARYGKILA